MTTRPPSARRALCAARGNASPRAAAATAALLATAGLLGAPRPAAAQPAPSTLFDSVLLRAEAAPERALALLERSLAARAPAGAAAASVGAPSAAATAQAREQALLRAWLAALQGRAGPDTLVALAEAAGALGPRLAEADSRLVLALQADQLGESDAEALARQALAAYEAHCAAAPAPAADCEYRQRWQARLLIGVHARGQHAADSAREQAQAALDLALAGRDRRRQAWAEASLAMALADAGELARAERQLARAQATAALLGAPHGGGPGGKPGDEPGSGATAGGPDAALQMRLATTEALLAWQRQDAPRTEAALQRALQLARGLDSPQLQAAALANLADHAAKTGRPRQALQSAEQGLALLRQAPADVTLRRILRNNALLARVALGEVAAAKRAFETLQQDWATAGEAGQQLSTLREFGDALAAAGDLPGALAMHHRAQALAARLGAANREAALAELRTRYDRAAQQRRIALLERDNALKTAELANQALQQRLWAAAGAVLVAAAVLVGWGLQRLRATRRQLELSRTRLREQSERDALTGLASRRHARAHLQAVDAAPGDQGFQGALLMLDIDRFKQINDQHGHAVGDQVLVEVARRLGAALRPQDLVARWGGEEFLVHAPGLAADDATALARRLLQAIGGAPVALAAPAPPGSVLPVTASIGQAVFPLPPHRVPVSAEQAINLADMALYIAKGQGRHRAVGIAACSAASAEALRALEADFERAWLDGQLTLHTDIGPDPAPPAQAGDAH